MKVSIRDTDALLAVSPAALSAYARVAGWHRGEPYRVHSDVYAGKELPEIDGPVGRSADYVQLCAGRRSSRRFSGPLG